MHKMLTLLLFSAAVSLASVVRAQTDVSASVYGVFTGISDGNTVTQSPSNAAGALFEVRHIKNPLVGFERRMRSTAPIRPYTGDIAATCGVPCGSIRSFPTTHVPANAHEITADWVASFRLLNLRPFLLAGGGLLLNVPAAAQSTGGNTTPTQTQTKGVLVYGGGLDYGLLPPLA